MSIDCDDALTRLYQYLDSELEEVSTTKIREHLDDCPDCMGRFEFETRLKIVVRQRLAEEVPPEFIQRLDQALARERALGC